MESVGEAAFEERERVRSSGRLGSQHAAGPWRIVVISPAAWSAISWPLEEQWYACRVGSCRERVKVAGSRASRIRSMLWVWSVLLYGSLSCPSRSSLDDTRSSITW